MGCSSHFTIVFALHIQCLKIGQKNGFITLHRKCFKSTYSKYNSYTSKMAAKTGTLSEWELQSDIWPRDGRILHTVPTIASIHHKLDTWLLLYVLHVYIFLWYIIVSLLYCHTQRTRGHEKCLQLLPNLGTYIKQWFHRKKEITLY